MSDKGLEGFDGWEATARGMFCSHDPAHGPRGARVYRTPEGVICEWCIQDLTDTLAELEKLADRLGVSPHARTFDADRRWPGGRFPTGAEVAAALRLLTARSTPEERGHAVRIVDLTLARWRRAKARGVPGDRNGAS